MTKGAERAHALESRWLLGLCAGALLATSLGLPPRASAQGSQTPALALTDALTPDQLNGNGSITVVNWADNRHLEIWVKGQDNSLYHSWTIDGLDWASLSPMMSDIACGFGAGHWPTTPDYVEVFAAQKNGEAQHMWWNEGSARWDGPQRYGADDLGDFSTLLWPDGRMEVFARTKDEGLRHRYWEVDKAQWSSWEAFGEAGTFASGVAPISWGDGRPELFATGKDGRIWNRWWEPAHNDWSEWSSSTIKSSEPIASRPIPVRWDTGRLEVFARGEDGRLYHTWFSDGAWQDMARLSDAKIKGEPSVIFNRGGSNGLYGPQIFARSEENRVLELHMENNNWTDFQRLLEDIEIASSPFAWVRKDGVATLFVIDKAGQLRQSRGGVTGWRAWSIIDGASVDGCDTRSSYLNPGNENEPPAPSDPDPPTPSSPDAGGEEPAPGTDEPDAGGYPEQPPPDATTHPEHPEHPDAGAQRDAADDRAYGNTRHVSSCASASGHPGSTLPGLSLVALWLLIGRARRSTA